MSTIERFEDLNIWQLSRKSSKNVYQNFKSIKDFGFRDQITRASVSVMNNIAEGFERESGNEFKRFLLISKASAGEVRSMLYLAGDIGYIDIKIQDQLIKEYTAISQRISKLITYLRKK